MAITGLPDSPVHAEPEEREDLERLRGRIDEIYHRGGKAMLVGPDANVDPVEVPASAFEALRQVVDAMTEGKTVVLMPYGKELTSQQAAEMLHVSRPHLTKLCDDGEIPFHRVGTHRRIRVEDVLAYRDQRTEVRREGLRTLTQLAEEAPGGYR